MDNHILEASQALANMRLDVQNGSTQIHSYLRKYHKNVRLEEGIISRERPDWKLFPTQDDAEKAKIQCDATVFLPGRAPPVFEFVPADSGKGAELLCSAFEKMGKGIKDFLEICRRTGRPPFGVLQQKFRRFAGNLPLELQEEDQKATIGFSTIPAPLGFIEDYIDYYLYLLPAFNGFFDVWRKNRICQECGNIFFYKLERAKFCSTTCQMRAAYKRRQGK